MNDPRFPRWLIDWMQAHGVRLWGAADLRALPSRPTVDGWRPPFALAWALPMNPIVMAAIQTGPNQAYADEYARVNARINELSAALAAAVAARGHRAKALAASERSDPVNIQGDFPHKTAATRAGIGWVGRHCQLVTRPFGSWVRLGTVFTDLAPPCGPPLNRSFCGRCRRCVRACPAGALKGGTWRPGVPRADLLDVHACDRWKKEHYFEFHRGHNCGICSAVCPYGLKVLQRETGGSHLIEKQGQSHQESNSN